MEDSWMEYTVRDFQAALASSSPTPGGGTAAAIALGQAAALSIMVCDLTLGNEKWKEGWPNCEKLLPIAVKTMSRAGNLADEDSRAFDGVMDSFKLPKQTDEEKSIRIDAIRKNTLKAALVPLETAKASLEIIKLLPDLAKYGNQNAISDVGVASLLASAACKGALFNVQINLSSLPDGYADDVSKDSISIMDSCRAISRDVMDIIKDRI